jgi:hypothetical protein
VRVVYADRNGKVIVPKIKSDRGGKTSLTLEARACGLLLWKLRLSLSCKVSSPIGFENAWKPGVGIVSPGNTGVFKKAGATTHQVTERPI